MTYRPRRRCWVCGTDRDDCGGLSRSGLCGPCGERRLAANVYALSSKTGPEYYRWLNGLSDAVAGLWGEALTRDPALLAKVGDTRTVRAPSRVGGKRG